MSQDASSPATPPVRTTGQPIAYLPESTSVAGSAVDVLLVLVTLLAGVLVLAWWAKRKGWLQRWTVGAAPLSTKRTGLRVEQALRLSQRTVLYRIIDGERRYLLAESTGTVRFITDIATVESDDHV